MVSISSVWLRSKRWLWLLPLLCVMSACSKPSTARSSASSEDLSDIFSMQRAVAEAENAVIACVKADSVNWVQHEFGWWYRYTYRSDEHEEYRLIAPEDTTWHVIHEEVYDLNGLLILDAIRSYQEKQKGEPFAYVIMLREMVVGDTVQLLLPWHTGYGKEGTDQVPGCTNLRVQLCLHDETGYDAIVEETSKQ